MKIAFVGPHGAGKTTAVWYVASYLKLAGFESVNVAYEVARFSPYPINTDSSFLTYWWMLSEQIQNESCLQSEVLILDRTVIDMLGYSWQCYLEHRITYEEYKFLWNVCYEWVQCRPYDLILYFPPFAKIPQDGVRSLDVAFQRGIDQFIREAIFDDSQKNWTKGSSKASVGELPRKARCEFALSMVTDFLDVKGVERNETV